MRIDGEWIGYYKAALYSGELGEGHAGYVTAGGEVSTRSGIPSPRMGSGQFATAGYGQAAFQSNHFYRDANMSTYPVQALSNMSVVQPACYTMALVGYSYPYALGTGVTRASPAPEMRTGGFYFGGPGCPR
ncbi:neprosin family prolyl endopeptidase [Xanthomonas oryzae]|uniref:neprosin family prolyl endopeptidase n=1 Tax=Xanthomonas oryzae TaxID=347 RepID=UPI00202A4412|nr:neprosin family prolyl endopeptidase [Xanthomonas oryzae]UWI56188.1 neprosin family prolyl endopeptidase [Xanthomonas oryzae pv. oryzae]